MARYVLEILAIIF